MNDSNINIIHVFNESVFIDFIINQFSNLDITSSFFCLLTGNLLSKPDVFFNANF